MRQQSTRDKATVIRNIDQLPIYEFYYWQKGVSNKAMRMEKMVPCCFHEERSASMHLHGANNNIFFKCFGCGKAGDLFKFVQFLMGCDFKTAVNDIYDRFCSRSMIGLAGPPPRKIPVYQRTREVVSIAYEEKPFTTKGLQWFSNCGLTEHDLHESHYCQAHRVIVTKPRNHYQIVSKGDDLTFVIYYPSGHVKVYRPLKDKENKWRSNVEMETDLYGSWWLRSFEPNIIQCSGPRDAAVMRKFTGIATVAPISENSQITLEQYQDLIRRLPAGKLPFILNDNDNAGYKSTERAQELYRYHDLVRILRHHGFNDVSQVAEHIIEQNLPDFFFSQIKSTINGTH